MSILIINVWLSVSLYVSLPVIVPTCNLSLSLSLCECVRECACVYLYDCPSPYIYIYIYIYVCVCVCVRKSVKALSCNLCLSVCLSV